MRFKIQTKINVFALTFVLMSFVCRAAIVSDNDGTAFVTKAEFEALKSDFNAQIDNYNRSIDNKIDGAIASYLAGIKVSRLVEIESLLNKVNSQTAYTRGWFPMCKTYSFSSTNKPVNGQLAMQILQTIGMGRKKDGWAGHQIYSLNIDSSDGLVRDTLVYVDKPGARTNGRYYCIEQSNDKTFNIYQGSYLNVLYKETLVGVSFGYTVSIGVSGSATSTWAVDTLKNESGKWIPLSTTVDNVMSMVWDPSGRTTLLRQVPSYFIPSYELTSTNQIWPIMGQCPTTNDTICLYLDKFSISTPSEALSTMVCGYKGHVNVTQNNTVKYFDAKSGKSATSLNWYYNYHPLESIAVSDIAVKEVSSVMSNKKYEFYCGLPICNIANNGTLTLELKFHSESGNKIHYAIKSSTFKNDSTYTNDTSLNLRMSDDTAITSQEVDDGTTLKLKCDVRKDTTLWIKAYDASDNEKYVGVETISIIEETD